MKVVTILGHAQYLELKRDLFDYLRRRPDKFVVLRVDGEEIALQERAAIEQLGPDTRVVPIYSNNFDAERLVQDNELNAADGTFIIVPNCQEGSIPLMVAQYIFNAIHQTPVWILRAEPEGTFDILAHRNCDPIRA